MNQTPSVPGEIHWIPLKEAARLLGCSVKTIRRRIKGGTWRSMIEYQGQKAIRLVAREDVVKESTSIDRLPLESPGRALALQALDGLPRELGEVLQSYLTELKSELNRKSLLSRVYLLIALGMTAILLTGIGLYLNNRQKDLLEGEIETLSRTLSITLSRGQANLGAEIFHISSLAAENRQLAESARDETLKQSQSLESIINSLDKLQADNRQSRRDAESSREELAQLRREIGRLENTVRQGVEPAGDSSELADSDSDDTPDISTPEPGREPVSEEPRSRFLGIF